MDVAFGEKKKYTGLRSLVRKIQSFDRGIQLRRTRKYSGGEEEKILWSGKEKIHWPILSGENNLLINIHVKSNVKLHEFHIVHSVRKKESGQST